jgi:hypothetical protein
MLGNDTKGLFLIRYVVHSVLASYGAVILVVIIEYVVGLAIGPQNRFLDFVVVGPTFLMPIVVGLGLGYRFGGSTRRYIARLVFAVPLIIAVYEVTSWSTHTYDGESWAKALWDNFLGTNCGSSECLEEMLISAPLFSSLAYVIGSELAAAKVFKRVLQKRS